MLSGEVALGQGENYECITTIHILPDDVLLVIFNSYRIDCLKSVFPQCIWVRLVHVCRRWRQIILASPHHLHLQLCCTLKTPVRKYLTIWPPYPIVIDYYLTKDAIIDDDAISAFDYPNRLCDISLDIATTSQLVELAAVMQKSFPALTFLRLVATDPDPPVLPSGFLGKSAPLLQDIVLHRIPFPEFPTLLLSARNLVTLSLLRIPLRGSISPEAMVTGLATALKLRTLTISFEKPTPHLEQKHLHPTIRTVLPSLTSFLFGGDSDYLESLVAKIECPRLNHVNIEYYHPRVNLQVSQLFQLISRSEDPRLTAFEWVHIHSSSTGSITVGFTRAWHGGNPIWIILEGLEWQSSHMLQVIDQFSTYLSKVRHLCIRLSGESSNLGSGGWERLLRQFTTVHSLCVSGFWALVDVHGHGEMVANLLPNLDLLCVGDEAEPSTATLDLARHISSRGITCVWTVREFEERLKSYLRNQRKARNKLRSIKPGIKS